MARSIKLAVQFQAPPNLPTHGFRIKITASDAVDMPNEIFRHIELAEDPRITQFSGVCSSVELETIPVNIPMEGEIPRWFRNAELDILVPSITVAQTWRDEIVRAARRLVMVLNLQDSLGPLEEITVT